MYSLMVDKKNDRDQLEINPLELPLSMIEN